MTLPSVNISVMTFFVFGSVFFSILLWFLVRKKSHRIWFPILRVVDIESKFLPKMTVAPPPWLPFICFLGCSFMISFLSFRPYEEVFTQFTPNKNRIHIYIDMSYSMKSNGTLEELSLEAKSLLSSLKDKGRITYSTSHSSNIYDFQNINVLDDRIHDLGFHREGLKIGDSIRYHMEHIGDLNLLIIISDRNRYSWSDFNWSYLKEKFDIRLVDFNKSDKIRSKNFIKLVKMAPSSNDRLSEWDIEIQRSGETIDTRGTLRATYKEKELYIGPWFIPSNKEKIELRIRWSHSMLLGKNGPGEDPIIWRIEYIDSKGFSRTDVFRTFPKGIKRKVILISDHGGEEFLDDPVHHLKIALEVLGFEIARFDRLSESMETALEDFSFGIFAVGLDRNISGQCPDITGSSIPENRNTFVGWLLPLSSRPDWEVVCQCFSMMSGFGKKPAFCKGLRSRDQYIGVLKSVGAKQVGGNLNDLFQSFAWHYNSRQSPIELLAFTRPMRPELSAGMTYAELPSIARSLVKWQNLSFKDSIRLDIWPRILSISDHGYKGIDDKKKSNIPSGENILSFAEEKSLPTFWNSHKHFDWHSIKGKKNKNDPIPWLKLILLVVILVSGVEALYYCILAIIAKKNVAKNASSILLFFFIYSVDSAEASIYLNTLSFGKSPLTAVRLAREVSSRTSIEFSSKVVNSEYVVDKLVAEPWIWSKNYKSLTRSDGSFKDSIVFWIKRGGLLILENAPSEPKLNQLTEGNIFSAKSEDGWKLIPPDHELMRSFHLLDSLPQCNGKQWVGFHFDGRLAILAIPGNFLGQILDNKLISNCTEKNSYEGSVRVFVNILMVALATDYKKDQIHLPEILKRLR